MQNQIIKKIEKNKCTKCGTVDSDNLNIYGECLSLCIQCFSNLNKKNIAIIVGNFFDEFSPYSNIDKEDYEEILMLTRKSFSSGVYTLAFQDHFENLFTYIMSNLHSFHEHYPFDYDDFGNIDFFYWDITYDLVIPYIVGLTPERFREYFENIGRKGPIYIRLERFSKYNEINWAMYIFD